MAGSTHIHSLKRTTLTITRMYTHISSMKVKQCILDLQYTHIKGISNIIYKIQQCTGL